MLETALLVFGIDEYVISFFDKFSYLILQVLHALLIEHKRFLKRFQISEIVNTAQHGLDLERALLNRVCYSGSCLLQTASDEVKVEVVV